MTADTLNTPDGLQRLGYRQELRRTLSVADLVIYGLVFMVVIAPFGIFGSVFQASGGMVALAYAVGMGAMMLTASSYGLMIQAYPTAGSVYAYAGRAIAPSAGLMAGWTILLDYIHRLGRTSRQGAVTRHSSRVDTLLIWCGDVRSVTWCVRHALGVTTASWITASIVSTPAALVNARRHTGRSKAA